jgi:hypothetical protein
MPALERLARAERRWEDLIAVLRRHAAALRDHAAASDTLCRAAEVADYQIGDPARAVALYKEALALQQTSTGARHGLLRVQGRQADWSAAAETLAQLVAACDSDEERAQLQFELARLREHRLNQPPDLELYRAAAKSLPHGSLLRVELTRIMRAVGSPDLADWLQSLGQGGADPALAGALLLESAYLRELGQGDPHGALEAARAAHQRQPESRAAIWCLERLLWANRDLAELGALREQEARLEIDPTVRVVKLSAAAAAHLHAGKAGEAARLARDCVNLDARALLALRLLAHLAEEKSQHAELAGLCDRLMEACSDASNRLEMCLRAAELWAERVGDVPRALASLGVVLSEQPGQPQAFGRAEQLLRTTKDFGRLFRLYARRIRSCEEAAEKVELLRQHARLLRDDLQDPNQAIAQFTELLTLAPGEVSALSELSELLIRQRHWSDAADKLGMLLKRATDPDVRRRARLQLGELWTRNLYEPRRAREVLLAALEESPSDQEARKLMVELSSAEGDWEGARRLLEQMAQVDDPAEKVAALVQLAEVARLGLRDEALRKQCEEEALLTAARNRDALALLVQHHRRERRQRELIAAAEPHLSAPECASGFLHAAVARLWLEDLELPARALEVLRAVPSRGETEEVRLLRARALEKQGELETAATEYREILAANITCVDAYRGLARVMERIGHDETVAAAAALADLVGEATPEETALLQGLSGATTPGGRLDISLLPLPTEVRHLHDLLAQVDVALAPLYPTTLGESLAAGHAAGAVAQRLADSLGLGRVRVTVSGQYGVTAGVGDPLPLVVAHPLIGSPTSPLFRFWVGRALATVAAHSVLVERLADGELLDLAEALTASRPESRDAQDLAKQLGNLLPRKQRKQLQALDLPSSPGLWSAFRSAEQRRADQVGLLMSRNPKEAILALGEAGHMSPGELASSPRLAHLMRYTLSEEYARLARALWA